ncbi:MAG: hypothetical protein GKR97_18815 [Rhizobiaceae bacterium]|nr:hypothetical protein [Rhizobiaceae bacterium]
MHVRSLLIIVLPLVALLLLSGCFKSQVALISEADADFPFQSITYEFDGEDDRVTLVRVGNSYAAPDEQGDSTLLVKMMKPDLFVIQASVKDGTSREYLYALAKLSGDKKSIELIKPYAEQEDRKYAEAENSGLTLCDDDPQLVCLTDLQSYVDYAVSSKTTEKKRIRILQLN